MNDTRLHDAARVLLRTENFSAARQLAWRALELAVKAPEEPDERDAEIARLRAEVGDLHRCYVPVDQMDDKYRTKIAERDELLSEMAGRLMNSRRHVGDHADVLARYAKMTEPWATPRKGADPLPPSGVSGEAPGSSSSGLLARVREALAYYFSRMSGDPSAASPSVAQDAIHALDAWMAKAREALREPSGVIPATGCLTHSHLGSFYAVACPYCRDAQAAAVLRELIGATGPGGPVSRPVAPQTEKSEPVPGSSREVQAPGPSAPSTVDLLPCPFCGGEPEIGPMHENAQYIACRECGTEGPFGPMDREAAIERWNKRTGAAGTGDQSAAVRRWIIW